MYCEKCHRDVLVPSPIENICIECYEKNDKDVINNNNPNTYKSLKQEYIKEKSNNKETNIKYYLLNYCKIMVILITIIGLCYSIYLATDLYKTEEEGWIMFFIILLSFPFEWLFISAFESIFNIESIVKNYLKKK